MAIKFLNIRSKEVRIAESEPQITAMWSSSDRSPNITQGQDFGWRMAPEVVVEMKKIKQNRKLLMEIAQMYDRPPEDVGEPEILTFISDKTNAENAPLAQEEDYTDEYEQEIRRLEVEAADEAHAMQTAQTVTTTTTESIAQLRERVELEERLAAAKAAASSTTTTTTKVPTTTTTTTKKP